MLDHHNTIVAVATPPGRGGVGIIRLSGQQSLTIAQTLVRQKLLPRKAHFVSVYNQQDQLLDQAVAVYFKAPHSFTGEDVIEIQAHGSPIVLQQIIKAVIEAGARLARPGEFSERAFLNEKIDLAQAEAIADLINASTEQAATSALRSLQGEFSDQVNQLVNQLIHLRMYVEAAIDFPEEEIDFLADHHVQENLHGVMYQLTAVQNSARQGQLLQEGMNVVIAGKPNAGKSSLLNALSGQDTAIVTDIAGTTRDILRESIQIDGMPLHIIDTAGLRESVDQIEQEGMRRAKQAIEIADMILLMADGSKESDADLQNFIETHFSEQQHKITIIKNKIDLLKQAPQIVIEQGHPVIYLSAKEKMGLNLLKEHLKDKVGFQSDNQGIFTARARHIDALQRAQKHLQAGQSQLNEFRAGELLAEELRQAQLALNEITGEFTSDDLLGKIFSSFCIGK